jgi:hypothetical protein
VYKSSYSALCLLSAKTPFWRGCRCRYIYFDFFHPVFLLMLCQWCSIVQLQNAIPLYLGCHLDGKPTYKFKTSIKDINGYSATGQCVDDAPDLTNPYSIIRTVLNPFAFFGEGAALSSRHLISRQYINLLHHSLHGAHPQWRLTYIGTLQRHINGGPGLLLTCRVCLLPRQV